MVIEHLNMHIIPRIDYQKIAEALTFYASCGFSEIQVPWVVGYGAYNATKPPLAVDVPTLHGYLNASGEQSFLELMLNGQRLGKHICVTPCFREEPVLDRIHHRYFLKAELIDTNVSHENLMQMIEHAKQFFEQYLPVEVIRTDEQGKAFDIISKNNAIELGSYGIRSYKEFTWIYGTGIALPRLDTAITIS